MKKMVTVTEVDGEGLVKFLGERVTLFCANYIYEGKLVGVNKEDILLEDAGLVFETGEFGSKSWKDRQKLPGNVYVRTAAIEMWTTFPKG